MSKTSPGIIALILAAILLAPLLTIAESIRFDDLYCFPRVSDPQFSPDGKRIVFEVSTTDLSTDKSATHLWIINSDGTGLMQLTNGPTDEWHPRWSPDGKHIAFISDREKTDQIWLLPIEGGDARKITSLSTGAGGAEWSASGKRLIFVSRVFPDCTTDSCNQVRAGKIESDPVKAKLYDHLMFRHYKSWDDGKINQLFIVDTSGRDITQLTTNRYDAPTSLLGGRTDYCLSNDGAELCYVMNTDSVPTLGTNNDLFIKRAENSETLRLTDNKGQDYSPQYSPDGRFLSYLSQARGGYESDQNDLILYDRASGKRINLTDQFDRSIGQYIWGPQSQNIYFTAIEYGFNKIWKINVSDRSVEKILDDAVYRDINISPDAKKIALLRSLSNQPYELYVYDIEKQKLKRITFFTEDFINRVDMNRAEEFWFPGTQNDSIHGFLTLPPDFDPQKKYPLVLLIHGGPQWCWLGDFNYYGWNTQLTAAQGYVVAQIDPHGSVGYGLKFKEYISGNWAKDDFTDLMLGIDWLINQHPYIDSTRMAALGRSYGGFMVNWICGHTDRFDCLIGIDGSFDQFHDYFTTDELWFPEWEFKGTPMSNPDEYRRASPSNYIGNFKTPTMIVHSQKDYRVDVSEGLAMYTALQRIGVPSQLLYYPDEGHSIQKIYNNRYSYEKQYEWLTRWLKR
jgi:dipeptidyl aminopeptidase/acylaminoacyl peptidase